MNLRDCRRNARTINCIAICSILAVHSTAIAQDQFEIIDVGKRATGMVISHRGRSSGSAFCVSKHGHFLTNNHVVRRVDKCQLVLNSGELTQKSMSAVVMHRDQKVDLADLKADGAEEDFHPLRIRNGRELRETERVLAFGYPYGKLLSARPNDYPSITVIVGQSHLYDDPTGFCSRFSWTLS